MQQTQYPNLNNEIELFFSGKTPAVIKQRGEENYEQVGGSHYVRLRLQPWDIIDANDIDCFYIGNVLKYILRYKEKGGVEDLKKAQHYLTHKIKKELEKNANST